MDKQLSDQLTLETDAEFNDPLERVAYGAGMMLDLGTIRDEQRYHRRRLNRHHYWLHGYGTVCGLAVRLAHVPPQPDVEETIRVIVAPGMAVDALGREVLVNEPYCINLNQWLAAQDPASLLEGYDEIGNILHLKVTARHKDCLTGLQPTLARKVNASTDAVSASRNRDSVLLELRPVSPDSDYQNRPWPAHEAIDTDTALEDLLTDTEQAYIDSAPEADRPRLRRQARLMHAARPLAENDTAEPAALAQVLLAHLTLTNVTDINDISLAPETTHANNLVRPFISGNSQLGQMI